MKSIVISFLVFSCLLISFNGFGQNPLEKEYTRMIHYYKTGQLSELNALCDTVLKKDKNEPMLYFFKGYALDLNKDRPEIDIKTYKQIVKYYSKSIELSNHTFFPSYLFRAVIHNSNFKYTEALKDYNIALGLSNTPEQAIMVLLDRSSTYRLLFEDEKAIEDLKLILKYDKNDTGAMINMGMIQLSNSKFEEAKKSFEQVLELEPNDLDALNNMGYTLSELEEYEGCIEYNDKVLELASNYDAAYNNRGFAKFKLGKIEEGIADIEKCIALNPTNSFAYRNLAEIYKFKKDNEKACEYVEKAKKYGFLQKYEGRIKSLNALCIE